MDQTLALINPGTQYTQQAVKRLKEQGFWSDVFDVSPRYDKKTEIWFYPTVDPSDLEGYAGYVILGSKHSVNGEVVPKVPDVFGFGKPVLGICYGTQFIADFFGGSVRNGKRQYGPAKTEVDTNCEIFANLEDRVQQVCMSHGDHVDILPEGFRVAATSHHLFDGSTFNDAIYNPEKKIFGLQFHPEVYLTTNGAQMLKNFAEICGLEPRFESDVRGIDYSLAIEERLNYLRDALIGNDSRIIAPVSGGVDSSAAVALLERLNLPKERVYLFHIDTGFNRLNESRQVIETYREMGWDVNLIDASDFMSKWRGEGNIMLSRAANDKLKRKLFQQAYQQVILNLIRANYFNPKKDYVLQGTLETDNVESGRGKGSLGSAEVKRHHNVGGPLDEFKQLTPLSVFVKDQVRTIAHMLGLPQSIVHRPPFPGPGNSVRIVSYESQRPIKEDFSYVEEMVMKTAKLYGFEAYVSPLIFVGTMGDDRGEGHLAIIQHQDNVNFDKLFELSTQIPWYSVGQNGSCITRIAYALNRFDQSTVKSFTPTFIDKQEIQLLQRAENIFTTLTKHNRTISQNVVYMTPNNFGKEGARTIVLRPVYTPDFMTLRPVHPQKEMPYNNLLTIRNKILGETKIAKVLLDITYKPNGSTEPY